MLVFVLGNCRSQPIELRLEVLATDGVLREDKRERRDVLEGGGLVHKQSPHILVNAVQHILHK